MLVSIDYLPKQLIFHKKEGFQVYSFIHYIFKVEANSIDKLTTVVTTKIKKQIK